MMIHPPIESELELTRITILLTDNSMIDYGSGFNVLGGLSAVGDDAVNYTSQITYTSTASISATHMLDHCEWCIHDSVHSHCW